MEDRKLSEKESLDIITQMINSSKRNMKVGSGNVLLYWGYFTVLLSVVISSLIVYIRKIIFGLGDGCSCLLSDRLFHISKEVASRPW